MNVPQHGNFFISALDNLNHTDRTPFNFNDFWGNTTSNSMAAPATATTTTPSDQCDNQLFLSITQQLAHQLVNNNLPNEFDVICGKGKFAYNHLGNMLFRQIVLERLDLYSTATTKMEKTLVVTDIMTCVRMSGGDFVKKASKAKDFQRVSERAAREKVGQQIRDALHTQYKSSTKAKKRKRVAAHNAEQEHIRKIVTANLQVTKIVTNVTQQVNEQVSAAETESSDDEMIDLFMQANLKMLDVFKDSNSAEELLAALTDDDKPHKRSSVSSIESSDDEDFFGLL
jgi:hypothetical protein